MTEPPPDGLRVEGLEVAYRVRRRDLPVLRGISFAIGPGEAYGLVGESGCGKSTVALAAVRYLPPNGRVTAGRIAVAGRDVSALDEGELRRLRARSVAMVHQDPGKALNPSLRIGRQLGETFEQAGAPRAAALRQAEAMLRRVRIADPAVVLRRYPHQLSGGMQQRVCIAAALATDPALLILDEPTTGLDATVEAEVLELIARLREELGTAILFISHNLAVVGRMCRRVGVLYAGELVEEGTAEQILGDPHHPYTVSLLRCLPRAGRRKGQGRLDTIPGYLPALHVRPVGCGFAERCALADDRCRATRPPLATHAGRLVRCHHAERGPDLPHGSPGTVGAPVPVDRSGPPLLSVRRLAKSFGPKRRAARALEDVSLDLWAGETLGLLGESGSGKSTLAKVLLGLLPPDDRSGELRLGLEPLRPCLARRTVEQVKALQIVFQNPDSALNRAHAVSRILGRALTKLAGLAGRDRSRRMAELAASVRLGERLLHAKPRQLSGGQKQRVAIARAFAGAPRLVVCDEPTSALDVSVQAAILNLLVDMQARHGVSYVFISHDAAVVRYLADRVAVLYLGRIVEVGPTEEIFAGPHHPYTAALLSAVPSLDDGAPARIRLVGEIPSAVEPPSGCVFHTRCHRRLDRRCDSETPPLREASPGHVVRCHLPVEALPSAPSAAARPIVGPAAGSGRP